MHGETMTDTAIGRLSFKFSIHNFNIKTRIIMKPTDSIGLTFPLESECTTDCVCTYTQQYGHSSGWDDNCDGKDVVVSGSSICASERTIESESAPVHQLTYILLAQDALVP